MLWMHHGMKTFIRTGGAGFAKSLYTRINDYFERRATFGYHSVTSNFTLPLQLNGCTIQEKARKEIL